MCSGSHCLYHQYTFIADALRFNQFNVVIGKWSKLPNWINVGFNVFQSIFPSFCSHQKLSVFTVLFGIWRRLLCTERVRSKHAFGLISPKDFLDQPRVFTNLQTRSMLQTRPWPFPTRQMINVIYLRSSRLPGLIYLRKIGWLIFIPYDGWPIVISDCAPCWLSA